MPRNYPRKTHWTSQLLRGQGGEEVVLGGWVWEVRDLGRIKFVVLRDREGIAQITAKAGEVDESLLSTIEGLSKEDAIIVRGILRRSRIAKLGVEVVPKELYVLSKSKPLPLDITGAVDTDLSTRLKFRAIDLKSPRNLAIFTIESEVVRSIRETLRSDGFVEVFTPKIIATATEGGAELFEVKYFDVVAYLAQSPQLYKEELTSSLERVFEIGPAYRAEKHDTNYHLNEFISVDIEAAFMDYNDVMDVLEEVVVRAYEATRSMARDKLGLEVEELRTRFPKIAYEDAVDYLRGRDRELKWGEDLSVRDQKILNEEFGPAIFVVDWPSEMRPFYTKRKSDNPKLSESFDLIIDGIEVASGSTRVHDKEELIREMRVRGLNVDRFAHHLLVYEYGMPPHAGWGLGLYRLLMVMLRLNDIREATLFPRDRHRLIP